MASGRFLAFEGIDGCGKTTQARRVGLARDALVTFEPGDTALGAALRAVLLEPGRRISPLAELLVMAADRSQHLDEVVVPTLRDGRDVVCDRYSGSTLAYQGYGRGVDLDTVRDVVHIATGGREPDVTILLDCPVELGLERRAGRRATDRFDEADAGFLERVREGFLEVARASPAWRVLDASVPLERLSADVDTALAEVLGG